VFRYIQGHYTCIGAYPEGHYIECNDEDVVCAQIEDGVHYYGDVLTQLDLIIAQITSPRYMHSDCPNPERNTIEPVSCNWEVVFGEQFCEVFFSTHTRQLRLIYPPLILLYISETHLQSVVY
jgi:hypothetical protein